MERWTIQIGLLLLAVLTMAGCEAIGGIFRAGLWVGLILALLVIVVVFAIGRMLRRR